MKKRRDEDSLRSCIKLLVEALPCSELNIRANWFKSTHSERVKRIRIFSPLEKDIMLLSFSISSTYIRFEIIGLDIRQAVNNMDKELQWRITTFFSYWKQRCEFIRDLDFKKNNHEANVLLWASLDALSNLWAGNIGKKQCGNKGKRLIFDAFLARYGGEIFQLVSLPDIWNRVDRRDIWVDRQKKEKLPEDVCTFLSRIGDRRTPTLIDQNQLRHSSDDWSLDTIITAITRDCPEANRAELEEWLTPSRYGALAYKKMRSAYIHEGRSSKDTHSFELFGFRTRPTYQSGIYTTPPTIGFNVEFMLGVLEFSINAFEADVLALQQDPVPEK
jgi:hypothetical protein